MTAPDQAFQDYDFTHSKRGIHTSLCEVCAPDPLSPQVDQLGLLVQRFTKASPETRAAILTILRR